MRCAVTKTVFGPTVATPHVYHTALTSKKILLGRMIATTACTVTARQLFRSCTHGNVGMVVQILPGTPMCLMRLLLADLVSQGSPLALRQQRLGMNHSTYSAVARKDC